MKVREKLRELVGDENMWLAVLAIVFAIAVSFFQIGFDNLDGFRVVEQFWVETAKLGASP